MVTADESVKTFDTPFVIRASKRDRKLAKSQQNNWRLSKSRFEAS